MGESEGYTLQNWVTVSAIGGPGIWARVQEFPMGYRKGKDIDLKVQWRARVLGEHDTVLAEWTVQAETEVDPPPAP